MKIYSINTKIKKHIIFKNFFNINNNIEVKYNYLIEFSNFLYKSPYNIIKNKNMLYICGNKIWIDSILNNNNIFIYGYSNSIIIKGLIAIVFIYFNNINSNNINKYNLINYINKFSLENNISNLKIIFEIEKLIKTKINNI